MIDHTTTPQNQFDSNTQNDSLNNLVWQSGPKGSWYLDRRVCKVNEEKQETEIEFINFEILFEDKSNEELIFKENDRVIFESKQYILSKNESNEIFLKLSDEAEKFQVNELEIKKFLKFNFIIIGKTKTFIKENISIDINNDVAYLKALISEFLSLPAEILSIHFKSKEISVDKKIFDLDVKEGDTFAVTFLPNNEELIQRSTSKTYPWYDRKNLIPFTVDKNITLTAVGFFRHYENLSAVYDFMLYELSENGTKKLMSALSNITVKSNECDAMNVKKVSISPIQLKANLKYYAYVYFKGNSDMKTYYLTSGNSEVNVKGMKIKFFDVVEPDHKSSSTSGLLPYMYFKFANPYSE